MHHRVWWKDRVRENGLISQMKRRAPRQAHVCVCSRRKGWGGVCGSCLDSPGSMSRERERSHKSSRRGAGFTLITIIRYFSLPLPLSLSFLYPALAQWALPLSFDPWKQLVMFFWRVWCTKEHEEKKKKFGNRRPLSDLDFGSLERPQGVHFFLSALVSLFFCLWDLLFILCF